jgi:hypothetical protein
MKASWKKVVGVGGIKCDCCRLGGWSKKHTRTLVSRHTRRAIRRELAQYSESDHAATGGIV